MPKQAVPLFLSKLLLLARYMSWKIAEQSVNPSSLFVLVQDQAFFKALFFTGDRGSDLGMVRTEEILHFPQDNGLLFNHVWGKTLRDGAFNVFRIRRHPNPELCPVKAIETYVAVASQLQVSITNSFLFHPTNHQGHIVNKPFTSSSVEARLKLYLKEVQINKGEMLHSFRSGSAITLALSGSQLADIMSHVGLNNKGTALYYMKLVEVLHRDSPSHLLSADCSPTLALTENYMDINHLKNFVSAFTHFLIILCHVVIFRMGALSLGD